ncbi:hypothetical protein [Phenylobacterium kunshanense]|uniref:TIGR02588 family protein n=1 Tax=Phenylobacterium kunshanense TaxID=1445034 RepID=A0A328BKS4_9CAUL|nr:hypothetical protein [Phenylobacterium kunshanense]RAK67567.1 hypothetical protein DJ019_06565 [Phenylobacterium kunshanense]
MAPRRKPAAKAAPRTPAAEWTAAALGLIATLAVLAYSLWEGFTDRAGPPVLSAASAPASRTPGGYVVPLVVRNESYATAASVEVSATLELSSGGREERRATFTYVPGQGEAKGGVMFLNDPARGRLTLAVEGYEEP